MAVVVAAVHGLIKCITCFLGQQFRDEEKVINYETLMYLLILCSQIGLKLQFSLTLRFPSLWCKITVELVKVTLVLTPG